MNGYTLQVCEDLISKYVNEYQGELIQLSEGSLGLGKVLLCNAKGKKTIIISEYYINAWSSGHTIRKYNSVPKKYQKIIDNN